MGHHNIVELITSKELKFSPQKQSTYSSIFQDSKKTTNSDGPSSTSTEKKL